MSSERLRENLLKEGRDEDEDMTWETESIDGGMGH